MLQVTENKVVTVHFRLTDDEGNEIETSRGKDPMAYIHGVNPLLPGLQEAMEGRNVGESFKAVLDPEGGYGERDEEMTVEVPRDQFAEFGEIEVGKQIEADDGEEIRVVTITEIKDDVVTIDLNHPLAGKTLTFEVDILEIRDATPTEIDHGHLFAEDGGCGCEH